VCFKKRYAILSHCNKITKDLEYVTLDEADYFENMPESLQSALKRSGNLLDRTVSIKGMDLLTIPRLTLITQTQEMISDWLDRTFREHAYLLDIG